MGGELIREMGRLGLVAPGLPERYGGMGIDGVTAGLLIEEIAYGDLNVAYVPLLSSLSADILARHADEELAAARLPAIAEGRETIALGLTEPRGGSDAANLQLRARRDGGDWVIDGEKASISMAAHADSVLAMARTDPDRPGARGVTAFLIDLDAPGVSRSAYDDLGSLAVGRGSIWFDGVRVPDRNRVGPEGAGFTQTMQGFDYSRTLIGLQCLGPARASLDETWPYTLEREAFGRPIAEFQGVTFPARRIRHPGRGLPAALLPHALVARPGNVAHQGSGDVQMVGAEAFGGHDPPVPADARPSRLQPGPAAPAAPARRHGPRDRRRHGADLEDGDRA